MEHINECSSVPGDMGLISRKKAEAVTICSECLAILKARAENGVKYWHALSAAKDEPTWIATCEHGITRSFCWQCPACAKREILKLRDELAQDRRQNTDLQARNTELVLANRELKAARAPALPADVAAMVREGRDLLEKAPRGTWERREGIITNENGARIVTGAVDWTLDGAPCAIDLAIFARNNLPALLDALTAASSLMETQKSLLCTAQDIIEGRLKPTPSQLLFPVLAAAWKLRTERDDALRRLEECEAGAVAKDAALNACLGYLRHDGWMPWSDPIKSVEAALATTAGRDLLAEVERLREVARLAEEYRAAVMARRKRGGGEPYYEYGLAHARWIKDCAALSEQKHTAGEALFDALDRLDALKQGKE